MEPGCEPGSFLAFGAKDVNIFARSSTGRSMMDNAEDAVSLRGLDDMLEDKDRDLRTTTRSWTGRDL